ncbi:MAG: CotH kinase family protein [Bacteroidota bacterium]
MKKHYLLYGVLLLLLLGACKKSDKFDQSPVTNPDPGTKGGNGSDPTISTFPPQLKNFKINGVSCAFDTTTNAYYYPVAPGASLAGFTVSFDTVSTKSILMDNVNVKTGGTVNYTLSTNENVAIKAMGLFNTSTDYNLIITGLPVVMLKTTSLAIGDDKIPASLNLVNPNYQAQGSKLEIATNINISLRGATARNLPKKSYSVKLVDAGGADTDIPLLGLRNDNGWILDAMYIDPARMRNRLCTDIWNSFNNVPYIDEEPDALNGTRGYMTEVFLNNKYQGVYCLTERLDRKQLKVKKQYGNIYKADDWSDEVKFLNISQQYNNSSANWGGWQFTYPEIGDTPAPDWKYLFNIVNFVRSASDEEFESDIKNKVDINNLVDYYIFMNILEAKDNQAKNTFFSFYDYRTAGSFFYSVWDLDGAMGRDYDGTPLSHEILGAGNNYLYQRLIHLNAANFKELIKSRWNYLKTNQLNKSTIGERIEAYRKSLVTTNAFARERTIWPIVEPDLNMEATYMTEWYSAQYDLFNNYVNGL